MRAVIDTSSLISLVRYYLPFDKNNILYDLIRSKIETGGIIIIDKVYEESKYTAKGIVLAKLDYLKDKKLRTRTDDLLPSKKFFNQVENQFINGSAKNKLTEVEFENRKDAFLDSADAKLILFCLKNKNSLIDRICLVTEETESSNDNKSFKKLPVIFRILELDVITLPELLNIYDDVDFRIE